MKEPVTFDLGLVEFITPEAVGKPGQRTFKVVIKSSRGEAVVWLEKEQLYQLGVSIKQLTSTRPRVAEPAPYITEASPQLPDSKLDFKVGDLALRHDAASDVFTLSAANFNEDAEVDGTTDNDDDEQPLEILVSFRRAQAERLADNAIEVVSSGRKPCPLCGGPVDPAGHFCVKKNGYHKQEAQ